MKGIFSCINAVIRVKIAELMAYRSHFFLSVLLLIVGDLVVPLITLLIYRSGASFPGWSLYEALLVQAIFVLAKGVAFPFFFGMVGTTLSLVREGTFDLLLLKPRPVVFMSMLNGFDLDELGRLLSGTVLLSFALSGIATPHWSDWLKFIIMFIASIIILLAMSLFMSGLLFRWVGSSRVFDIFDAVTRFGMYPATIFSKQMQYLFVYIFPIGLIAFVPASALLGRESWGILWALISAGCLLLLCVLYWNKMLKSYSSAGG